MNWFIRLFLLLGLFLFGEAGLHAASCQHRHPYSGIKYHNNLADGTLRTPIQQPGYAPPIQHKREYRNIKDAEEEDDDRRTLRQKKRKDLESNAGKFTLHRPPAAPRIISQYYFPRRKSATSPYPLFCAKHYRLYNLFQVFKI